MEVAKKVHSIYIPGYAFPEWVVKPELWPSHRFSDTITFYHKEDSLDTVKLLMTEREPCNIGMRRIYSTLKMESEFGWKHGAYRLSTKEHPMPNVAVYCNATVYTESKGFFNVHVLNLIGCALDSYEQPDYKYIQTRQHVLDFYTKMWRLALKAAKYLKGQGKINRFIVYNVGGGAFSGEYGNRFISDIFEPAFLPLMAEFSIAGIEVIGYKLKTSTRTSDVCGLGFIPDVFDTNLVTPQDLFINAWDPWSLIGNGNERDDSLDGHWGRISNMAVLGWLKTNPQMKFMGV